MLLGTLGGSSLGNISADTGINRARKGIVESVMEIKKVKELQDQVTKIRRFLMRPYPLTNFEIQKYYQNEPRLNGVFSRDNLPKIKDGAYVINLDEYSDIGTLWKALYVLSNNVTYFDSFGVEHIPKEIRAFISNKNIKTNIFRIQAYSIMCRYLCIFFINFMLTGKTLTKFTNLFSSNSLKKWWYNSKLFYEKSLTMPVRSSAEWNSIKCNIYPNLGVPLSATPLSAAPLNVINNSLG